MTLEILDNDGIISKKVQRAINKKIFKQQVLDAKLQRLDTALTQFLYNKFLTSETYASLAGGILRAEFGLDDSEVSNLPYIIEELVNVRIDIENHGANIGIYICDKNIDFDSIGYYVSESKRGSFFVHWLYWLLTQGESVVVPEFSIWLKPGAGRSEMAFMFLPKEGGGSYSVDGQFSGIENDNWITRTLRDNKEEIKSLIKSIMNN